MFPRIFVAATVIALMVAACATGAEKEVESLQQTGKKAGLPPDYPPLSNNPQWTPNRPPIESVFIELWYSNEEILDRLKEYDTGSIAKEFNRRLAKATDKQMKLLLATVAAGNGSTEGKSYIQNLARNTEFKITFSRLAALYYLIEEYPPQQWVFDAINDALRDTRETTIPKHARREIGAGFEVSYLADEYAHLTYALGYHKNPESVPVLIEMAKRTNGSRGPVGALGILGDSRAIPVLMEFLKGEDASNEKLKPQYPELSEDLVVALSELRAKETVPILLKYLRLPTVIEALGDIGDERAIEPLKAIIANNDKISNKPQDQKDRQEAVFTVRMALTKLEKDDPYPKWIEMLQDQTLEWVQRREVVKQLAYHADSRAIPFLIKAIKTDPNGEVVNPCIEALTYFKFNAAVSGLIECFDANFDGKADWKRAYSPEMFRKNIGISLYTLTGQNFGADKAKWLKWWNEHGSQLSFLE